MLELSMFSTLCKKSASPEGNEALCKLHNKESAFFSLKIYILKIRSTRKLDNFCRNNIKYFLYVHLLGWKGSKSKFLVQLL